MISLKGEELKSRSSDELIDRAIEEWVSCNNIALKLVLSNLSG